MRINVEKTGKVAAAAGGIFSSLVRGVRGQPVLCLFSGGSALLILDHLDVSFFGKNVTMSMLDERWSRDPAVNNFLKFSALSFYRRAAAAGAYFIETVPRAGETLKEFGDRCQSALRAWADTHPGGKVFATFGVGEDGHTAGIMPFPEDPKKFSALFERADRFVAVYDAGPKSSFPLRATVTFSFLRTNLAGGVLFVRGEGKHATLGRLLAPEGTLAETPSRILRELPNITLCTDITSG